MSKAKRLHPVAAISNFLKQLKELIVPFIVFVVLGSKGTRWDYFYLVASIVTIIYVLIMGVLSWLRYTYRIEEGELRIEYGVFVRKKRYIPIERIQSLDLSEGILHRPFGLVKVKVETAGSSAMEGAEAELTAITKLEAKEVEAALIAYKKTKSEENSFESEEGDSIVRPSEEIIYQISIKELILLSITSGGVGVVLSAIIAFVFQFEEIIPYEKVFHQLKGLVASGFMLITLLVFAGFLLAWIAALIGTMIKYANFTVKKLERDLIIQRGILEKRQLTIPLNRIQAVRISENLIRQPLGYGTVYLESAGGSVKDIDSAKVMMIPIMKKKQIVHYLEAILPEYKADPVIEPVPIRALKRYILKSWMIVAPFMVTAIVINRPWGYLSLIGLPLVTLWQYINFQTAGWALSGDQLTLRYRNISKSTVFLQKNKIQSLTLKESYFQQKKQLMTIQAVIKSGSGASGGTVIDLEKKNGLETYRWYSSPSKNGTNLTLEEEGSVIYSEDR